MDLHYVITVDWGTSFLRAYLCEITGQNNLRLIDTKIGRGVCKCDRNFEQELMSCIEGWEPTYGKLPVFMAGQIGSSIGWKEAQYLPCPLTPIDVAFGCFNFEVNGYEINIVPGASCQFPDESFDVMRGEEVQILGWMQLNLAHQSGTHIVCLPGTHTKWVLIKEGVIQYFKTAMTGELFDILSNRSLLIEEPNDELNIEAFTEGAEHVLQGEAGGFSHDLFSVRSKQVMDQLGKQQAESYLSGILLAADVRAASQSHYWNFQQVDSIHIVGSAKLSDCFAKVLTLMGYKNEIYDAKQTSLLGFASIFKQRIISNV